MVGDALPFVSGPAPARPAEFSAAATALRKAAHKVLAAVEDDIEKLAFNRAVARIYELANTLQKAVLDARAAEGAAADAGLAAALHEAFDILVRIIAPMMPHLAEECWQVMERDGLLATSDWPVADRALIVDDTIVLPIQINGKKRAELTIGRDASEAEVTAATLALEAVVKALDGKAPRKVIVVPQRIVNVVA